MTEKMMSEKKKETIRIGKKDLLILLSEHEHMTKQITELQTRLTELTEENRVLKGERLPQAKGKDVPPEPSKIPDEEKVDFPDYSPPDYSPRFPRQDIYFDGSNK